MDEFQSSSSMPPPPIATAGLADNIAGALAYITILPAILFLILEPYSRRPFIRFNAFQCITLAVTAFALHLLMIIPILGWIVVILGDLCLFVAWILCVVKAYQGVKFKLPLLGDLAEKLANQA
jgi:uncharacterized membrane protein